MTVIVRTNRKTSQVNKSVQNTVYNSKNVNLWLYFSKLMLRIKEEILITIKDKLALSKESSEKP